MVTRRSFISQGMMGTAGMMLSSVAVRAGDVQGQEGAMQTKKVVTKTGKFRPGRNFGIGGVAIGNAFKVSTNEQCEETLAAAWRAGVRYFDNSPWYGLGISERRFGHFLSVQPRDEFIISSKVGRLLTPDKNPQPNPGNWKGKMNANYRYDYTAAGVRRSVEDSLQRMGLTHLDIVFIHDLSPDNKDMKDNWLEYFHVAAKEAMPELTKMREQGLIKAWGLGVNTIEPILKTIEMADPDIFLCATQYSLIKHEDALHTLFPVCGKRDISLVIGAPLNAGFLAGVDRYDYDGTFPPGVLEKRKKLTAICDDYEIDLRTAALQFCAAPSVVSAVIPGCRQPEHAKQNVESMFEKIPSDFWKELKYEKLIAEHAPEPTYKE